MEMNMSEFKVVLCPECDQRLRVPLKSETLKVKCPTCRQEFILKNGIVYHTKEVKTTIPVSSLTKRKKLISKAIVAIVVAIPVLVIGFIFILNQVNKQRWITISYKELIVTDLLTHSGKTLQSALQDIFAKGEVQPYVDKFSYLLQPTVEMIFGPDSLPHHNVIDHYPVGSGQPAWAALFRGGRVLITTDDKRHARVFLIGYDPEVAYKENYSVIRHCLTRLLPQGGSELKVDVFAYKNNYKKSELRLNPICYKTSSSSFPPPSGTVPLDLIGLEEFFKNGGQLEGAQLNRNVGLLLFAKKGKRQTVADHNVTLSDFAVAYRAVFHAGDNKPYISLDPHKDPTKATVNFGGFLEDTRIGSVVLEADKRFKTITSGLDPNSFKDLSNYTRKIVPSFLTCSERDLLTEDESMKGKWIATRFWFYPDSIQLETDNGFKYAKIVNPQFTADAERTKDDFTSPEEFERKKKTTLSPSIRTNINHLNHNYLSYAEAYHELKELTAVARLMGICSWLRTADPDWLDLDLLLSVELPPCRTERERTRLIAVSYISYNRTKPLTEEYVRRNSKVLFLSSVLDRTVENYFKNSTNLAAYLCYKNDVKEEDYKIFEPEAKNLLLNQGREKVRDVICTNDDLKALAFFASDRIEFPFKKVLKRIEAEITKLEVKIDKTTDYELYSSYADSHNQLVDQYNAVASKIDQLNYLSLVRISGGVGLDPGLFNIKSVPNGRLKEFKKITEKVKTNWSSVNGSEHWIRSRASPEDSKLKKALEILDDMPDIDWEGSKELESDSSEYIYYAGEKHQNYWLYLSKVGSWRDLLELKESLYRERLYDCTKKIIHIANFESCEVTNYIVGEWVSKRKIVFSRYPRSDLIVPQEPPIWWMKQ